MLSTRTRCTVYCQRYFCSLPLKYPPVLVSNAVSNVTGRPRLQRHLNTPGTPCAHVRRIYLSRAGPVTMTIVMELSLVSFEFKAYLASLVFVFANKYGAETDCCHCLNNPIGIPKYWRLLL